jgi:hypothetical protein
MHGNFLCNTIETGRKRTTERAADIGKRER